MFLDLDVLLLKGMQDLAFTSCKQRGYGLDRLPCLNTERSVVVGLDNLDSVVQIIKDQVMMWQRKL